MCYKQGAIEKINESEFNQFSLSCLILICKQERIQNAVMEYFLFKLYFTDELWPDFDEGSFKKVIDAYDKRKRNYGNIK